MSKKIAFYIIATIILFALCLVVYYVNIDRSRTVDIEAKVSQIEISELQGKLELPIWGMSATSGSYFISLYPVVLDNGSGDGDVLKVDELKIEFLDREPSFIETWEDFSIEDCEKSKPGPKEDVLLEEVRLSSGNSSIIKTQVGHVTYGDFIFAEKESFDESFPYGEGYLSHYVIKMKSKSSNEYTIDLKCDEEDRYPLVRIANGSGVRLYRGEELLDFGSRYIYVRPDVEKISSRKFQFILRSNGFEVDPYLGGVGKIDSRFLAFSGSPGTDPRVRGKGDVRYGENGFAESLDLADKSLEINAPNGGVLKSTLTDQGAFIQIASNPEGIWVGGVPLTRGIERTMREFFSNPLWPILFIGMIGSCFWWAIEDELKKKIVDWFKSTMGRRK